MKTLIASRTSAAELCLSVDMLIAESSQIVGLCDKTALLLRPLITFWLRSFTVLIDTVQFAVHMFQSTSLKHVTLRMYTLPIHKLARWIFPMQSQTPTSKWKQTGQQRSSSSASCLCLCHSNCNQKLPIVILLGTCDKPASSR